MRTFTDPPSSTLLASSRRLQLLSMALHSLLWSSTSPELPQGEGLGIAHPSTHGNPRSPLDQSTPAKEEHSATSSTPRKVARELPPIA